MRKIVSIVFWSAQQWIDSFPCPLLLRFHRDNGVVARKIGCPLSANSNSISSAIWSQAPCGLFSSVEYHFFSEPGPINDHCPKPNLFASTLTTLAFAKHSSLLPFLSQEMSLNIDIKWILPVKVSGVSPKLLSRSLTLPLQRCESWEDVPLEFSRLSIDSVIVSVALISRDPFNPFLPSFVGFRMLMDLSKAQHRIWKDVDFCALKIDNGFITNQWQLFPWILSPLKFCPNCWSHLVHSPILMWCRTCASKWDLWNSWWNFEYPRNSFPWMSPHSSSQPWTFPKLLNALLRNLQRSTFFSVFFALDLLLYSQILLRHFPWRKFPILPLLGN